MFPSKLSPLVRYTLFGLAVFVVAAILTLGGVAYAYKDKYLPGTKVGTVALGGKSKAEGERLVAAQVKQYEAHPVIVTVPDITQPRNLLTNQYPDVEVKTDAHTLGIAFASVTSLTEAWNVGHVYQPLTWLQSALHSIFYGSPHPLVYSVDRTQVDAFINTQVVPKIVVPTPAQLVINKTNITVEEQKQGLDINQTELAKQLADSLAQATDSDTTYLHAPVSLVDSTVTSKTLQPIVDELNSLGNLKITLATSDGAVTLKPNREQLLSWFSPVQDDMGMISLSLSQDVVGTYIQKNGRNLLNQKDSLAAVTKALGSLLNSPQSFATPLKPISVTLSGKPAPAAHFAMGDFTGKYIEIDLKDQRMFLINNKVVEKSYIVSSGKWSTPTPTTPAGTTFHIASKSLVAYSSTFKLYMPFWENFVDDAGNLHLGEFGIHGLPYWASGVREGASHIGVPVSHGCVRLGPSSDEEVYNWTSIGTPIVIY